VQQFDRRRGQGESADGGAVLARYGQLNREFAWCVVGAGSSILWETADDKGRPVTRHLSEETFRKRLAGQTVTLGDGDPKPIAKAWLDRGAPVRRSYDGIVFDPSGKADARFYNLWRGFAYTPAADYLGESEQARAALESWKEHLLKNACGGDAHLARWLTGYFAHMIQRPWEKPLTALVFRGGKGVGKNALVERVGNLLGAHTLVAADRRYLTSNFNSHLENLLLLVLDEAFWSGDKQSEGVLKSLITGSEHNIERKGLEPYRVANLTRVVILGNEDWLVPASADERRYAVFDVGEGRKQDRAFFQKMREGMEGGGYRLLLKYLQDFDLASVDVNEAPKTDALREQKEHSLSAHQRFFEALAASEGEEFAIFGAKRDRDNLVFPNRNAFSEAAESWLDRRVKSGRMHGAAVDRELRSIEKLLPSMNGSKPGAFPSAIYPGRKPKGSSTPLIVDLAALREAWARYLDGGTA
jgi:hypothetical protein